MVGLIAPDTGAGQFMRLRQQRRSRSRIMGIGGEDAHQSLGQHALCPVLRALAEAACQRSCRDLHPHAGRRELLHHRIVSFDPFQPLGMRQHGHETRNRYVEHEVFKARRKNVMRRLHKNVAAVMQGEDLAHLQALREVRADMGIGADDKGELQSLAFKHGIEMLHPGPNVGGLIVVHSRHEMGCASHHLDPVCLRHAADGERVIQ